jgi:hypothetical protein
MTPKEKAIQLVNMYLQVYDGKVKEAKQCALIAVDEINIAMDSVMFPNPFKQYWEEVKKEIENY